MTSRSLRSVERGLAIALWCTAAAMATHLVWRGWNRPDGDAVRSIPFLARPSPEPRSPVGSVHVLPYTIELHESIIASDGARERGMVRIEARRGDGARASRIDFVRGRLVEAQRILWWTDGRRVVVDEIAGVKSTVEGLPRPPSTRDPARECRRSGPEGKGRETMTGRHEILGFEVFEFKQANVVRWFAPLLECAELFVRLEYREGDVSEQRAVSVVPGEPSPSLFSVDGLVEKERPDREMRKGER